MLFVTWSHLPTSHLNDSCRECMSTMAIFCLQCTEHVLRASSLVGMDEVVCRWHGIVTLTLTAPMVRTKTTAVSVDLKQDNCSKC